MFYSLKSLHRTNFFHNQHLMDCAYITIYVKFSNASKTTDKLDLYVIKIYSVSSNKTANMERKRGKEATLLSILTYLSIILSHPFYTKII